MYPRDRGPRQCPGRAAGAMSPARHGERLTLRGAFPDPLELPMSYPEIRRRIDVAMGTGSDHSGRIAN